MVSLAHGQKLTHAEENFHGHFQVQRHDHQLINFHDLGIHPEEIAPCPVNGLHHMISSGFATIYYTETNKKATDKFPDGVGGIYVCKWCDEYFLAEGYPHFGGKILNYVTHGGIDWAAYIGGAGSFYVYKSLVYFIDSSFKPGFRFFSN